MANPKHEPFEFDNEWDQLVSKVHSRITQLRDAPLRSGSSGTTRLWLASMS